MDIEIVSDTYRIHAQTYNANQHDWHCMAYAIFLLKQYHDGEL